MLYVILITVASAELLQNVSVKSKYLIKRQESLKLSSDLGRLYKMWSI